MKSYLLLKTFIGVCLMAITYSCIEPPEYDNPPHIDFQNVEVYSSLENRVKKDSLILVTSFEDGDGDLGLDNEDLETPPFNLPNTNNGLNYFVDILIKKNGAFQTLTLPSGFTFNGRFFRLAPDGRIGPIEGDLRYSIVIRNNNPLVKEGDVLKFRVWIRDRALNQSNIVESDEVTIFK